MQNATHTEEPPSDGASKCVSDESRYGTLPVPPPPLVSLAKTTFNVRGCLLVFLSAGAGCTALLGSASDANCSDESVAYVPSGARASNTTVSSCTVRD
jgi:hypothetical protein